MLSKTLKFLEEKERTWRESFGNDISTPALRRQTMRHFNWVDHGVLRILWTNFHPVAPGVFRSNQPSQRRLRHYAEQGIKAVLNLRGTSRYSYYLFERETCDALGLTLVDINLSATELPTLDTIWALENHFQTLPQPFVLHCKSGADRAGFAAALYLLLLADAPIAVAQRQLSFRYLHIKRSRKGILDYCLEKYRKRTESSAIPFRDWLMQEYDPKTITAEFLGRPTHGKRG